MAFATRQPRHIYAVVAYCKTNHEGSSAVELAVWTARLDGARRRRAVAKRGRATGSAPLPPACRYVGDTVRVAHGASFRAEPTVSKGRSASRISNDGTSDGRGTSRAAHLAVGASAARATLTTPAPAVRTGAASRSGRWWCAGDGRDSARRRRARSGSP
ncbi:hypothetical protein ACJJTC_018680 [Scirpophaga incertulas]